MREKIEMVYGTDSEEEDMQMGGCVGGVTDRERREREKEEWMQ